MRRSLKTSMIAAGLCLAASAAVARADVLLFEDFQDTTFTFTTAITQFIQGSQTSYYSRAQSSQLHSGGYAVSSIPSPNFFFAAADIDGGPGTPSATQDMNFTFSIAGYNNLSWSSFFAEDDNGTLQSWDSTEFLHVDYSIDGGAFAAMFWIQAASATNAAPRVDADFNGVGEGTEITSAFQQFTRPIVGTGTSLTLRVRISSNGSQEDIAFDNFQVTGDLIPEPASAGLLGLAGLALLRRRRA